MYSTFTIVGKNNNITTWPTHHHPVVVLCNQRLAHFKVKLNHFRPLYCHRKWAFNEMHVMMKLELMYGNKPYMGDHQSINLKTQNIPYLFYSSLVYNSSLFTYITLIVRLKNDELLWHLCMLYTCTYLPPLSPSNVSKLRAINTWREMFLCGRYE